MLNQTNQFIFALLNYLLNVRDTLQYTMKGKPHPVSDFEKRKFAITKGLEATSPFGHFLADNPQAKEKIEKSMNEMIHDLYSDESTIIKIRPEEENVTIDNAQNIQIFDYVVGVTESIRDVIYGYLNFARSKNESEDIIVKLVDQEDRFYRLIASNLLFTEFDASFASFQKVMTESKGQPTPQSNYIVQNEIAKIANLIRFVREHHHCIDNKTLDVLDKLEELLQCTEGRRERRENKNFGEIFKEFRETCVARLIEEENTFNEMFQKVLAEMPKPTPKPAENAEA